MSNLDPLARGAPAAQSGDPVANEIAALTADADALRSMVSAGDIVCTKAGDEHDVLEVYEDLEGFWFEDATPPGGRIGHLHRDEIKAKGHPVPGLPVPADFPRKP